MKNKEIEELLNDMRHSYEIHEEIIKKYNNADKISYPYTINLKQIDLLLSYIEQLEIKNDVLIGKKLIEKDKNANEIKIKAFKNKDYINELQKKIEQLENNRDKAIEILKGGSDD